MDRFRFIKHLIYQHKRYNGNLDILLLQLSQSVLFEYNSINTRVCSRESENWEIPGKWMKNQERNAFNSRSGPPKVVGPRALL